jgi:hypothetical protein
VSESCTTVSSGNQLLRGFVTAGILNTKPGASSA